MSTSDASLHPPEKAAGEQRARFGKATQSIVLLILAQAKSYGYDIRRRLEDFGYDRSESDPGALYRLLRELETEGFITSEWTTAGTGPARRYYSLTGAGQAQLRRGATGMATLKRRAELFLETYRELGFDLEEPVSTEARGELVAGEATR